MKRHLCLTSILLCLCACLFAQDSDSTLEKITDFPNRLFSKIRNKTASLNEALTKQTAKYLQKLAKREARMERKLSKTDSVAAKNLFAGVQQKYVAYEQLIKSEADRASGPMSGEYLPYVDSLKGCLSFLQQDKKTINAASPKAMGLISSSLGNVKELQTRLQQADRIKAFISERKQKLREYLANYINSTGLKKYMDAYSAESYYYSEQVREYREAFNNPTKLEQKALALLNVLPSFREFMKNNSFLSGLFGVPADYGTSEGLFGLQTRNQVQSLIQSQIGSGPNAQAMLSQNLQTAQKELNQFKDKLSQLGGGSGDIDMPNFKPNAQRTKSFLRRLEYGTNFQTTRSGYFYPSTTDLALSVGYRLNNTSTIGIAGSYKVGWGKDISHIALSSEGMGLRSFLDAKLKGSFYISGGYEENFQPASATLVLPPGNGQLIVKQWVQSGLLGVSKVVSMNSKIFKKTRLQLLWDFLSYQQIPKTEPIKFRVGYNF